MNLPPSVSQAIHQSQQIVIVLDRAIRPSVSVTATAQLANHPPSPCRNRGIRRTKTPPSCRWDSIPGIPSPSTTSLPAIPERRGGLKESSSAAVCNLGPNVVPPRLSKKLDMSPHKPSRNTDYTLQQEMNDTIALISEALYVSGPRRQTLRQSERKRLPVLHQLDTMS